MTTGEKQLFGGRYRVVTPLGAGGFGEVFAVFDQQLGGKYALKRLRPHLFKDARERQRFLHEARIANQIADHSPHVVRVHNVGIDESDGSLWFIMDLLSGETLEKRVARQGPIPKQEATVFLQQIAHALAAAHALQIVHRDLKPANVFLARDSNGRESVRLLDFGIAKLLTEATQGSTSTAVGSLLWMAPEQLEGRPTTTASDVWAFAKLAYFVFTGLEHRTTDAPGKPASAHAAKHQRTVPRGFDPWFARCTELDPQKRYADAGVAWRALATVLSRSTASRVLVVAPLVAIAMFGLCTLSEPANQPTTTNSLQSPTSPTNPEARSSVLASMFLAPQQRTRPPSGSENSSKGEAPEALQTLIERWSRVAWQRNADSQQLEFYTDPVQLRFFTTDDQPRDRVPAIWNGVRNQANVVFDASAFRWRRESAENRNRSVARVCGMGPLYRVELEGRATALGSRPFERGDGCLTLAGTYLLRVTEMQGSLQVCWESWSNEAVCASCPNASDCRGRP